MAEASYVSGISATPLIGETIGAHFDRVCARHADRDALEKVFLSADVFKRDLQREAHFDGAKTEVAGKTFYEPEPIFGRALDVYAQADEIEQQRPRERRFLVLQILCMYSLDGEHANARHWDAHRLLVFTRRH